MSPSTSLSSGSQFQKLLVNHWFRTYEVIQVTEECFKASPEIEACGSMTGFKVKDNGILEFRITELQKHGFIQAGE